MTKRLAKLKFVAGSGQYGLNFPATDYVDHGIRLIRTTDLVGGTLASNENGIFVPEHAVSSGDKLLPGDLLLSRSGTIGRAYLTPSEAEGMAFAGFLVRFRPGPEVETRYLFYCTQSNDFQFAVHSDAISSTIQNFNADRYNNIKIPLPPFDEQRAIADYLDQETAQIDALVAKQEEFIGLLRERYESVVRAETSRFEEPYRIDKLGRSTRVGNGSTPKRDVEDYWSKGEVPWLTSTAVNSPEVKNADQFITEQAVIECHLPVVNPGDLLIGLIGQGPTRGKTTICRIRATLSQNLAYISPDRSKWVSEYLLWLLRAKYSGIRQKGAESGAAQGMLNTDDIRRIRVAMPCIAEQKQIVARLEKKTSRIDTLIAKAEEHIALAKERRSALITAAVTGQLDVRTAKKGARV